MWSSSCTATSCLHSPHSFEQQSGWLAPLTGAPWGGPAAWEAGVVPLLRPMAGGKRAEQQGPATAAPPFVHRRQQCRAEPPFHQ